MLLQQTRQQTNPNRRIRTDGSKKRLVHGVKHYRRPPEGVLARQVYGLHTYCGCELSNPIEFEGKETEVTCPRCLKNAGKKWREKFTNLQQYKRELS